MSYIEEQRKLPKVPVRYTGAHVVQLRKVDGPYKDANNVPLESLLLPRGQDLQMSAIEVYGTTYLFDPRNEKPPRWLGLGRVILDEHQEYATSAADLERLGYEFHLGRTDVEPLLSLEEYQKRLEPAQAIVEQQPEQQISSNVGSGSEEVVEDANGTRTVSG